MRESDYAFIKLHHDYDISFIVVLRFKYNQQYVKSFKMLKRVNRLVYKLKLSTHWRIHSILFITQLKSISSFNVDSFQRSKSNQSNSIFVENDIEQIKFYEIKRLVNKDQIKRRDFEYLIRWHDYKTEHDDWRNLFELKDAQKLIQNYEQIKRKIVILSIFVVVISSQRKSERSRKFLIIDLKKSFVASVRKTIINTAVNDKSTSTESISKSTQSFVVVIFKIDIIKAIIESATTSKSSSISKSPSISKSSSLSKSIVDFLSSFVSSSVADVMILRRSNRLQ